jgi:hypothetical protein
LNSGASIIGAHEKSGGRTSKQFQGSAHTYIKRNYLIGRTFFAGTEVFRCSGAEESQRQDNFVHF